MAYDYEVLKEWKINGELSVQFNTSNGGGRDAFSRYWRQPEIS
jgi:hypothetical protein